MNGCLIGEIEYTTISEKIEMSTLKPLKSKTALITGATGGYGKALSCNFIKAGASLVLIARSRSALESLAHQLSFGLFANQEIKFFVADLRILKTISELVNSLIDQFGVPDIVINNAGIQGPIGRVWENSWSEWEETMTVNLLAPVVLTRALLPKMITRGSGKIIYISGGGATAPRPNFTAYSCSKAAIVRFSETLAEELKDTGITVNCIAPGVLNTKMLQTVLDAGPELAGEKEYDKALQLNNNKDDSVITRAADAAVFLASSASDRITGKLISAVWDPWETLPKHIDELDNTDIYTLRRIVPKDRGMAWGG